MEQHAKIKLPLNISKRQNENDLFVFTIGQKSKLRQCMDYTFSSKMSKQVLQGNASLESSGRSGKIYSLCILFPTVCIRQDSKLLASLMQKTFVSFLAFLVWSGAEIKCTVHVALPKWPINQFKLDQLTVLMYIL